MEASPIKVAIADFSPLIIDENGTYTGFEIDLWEAIAKELHIDFQYEKHAFQDILPLIAEKKIDMGLAGITINEKRERIIDFSHPTLDSGLLVLINTNSNRINIFGSIKLLLREGHQIITRSALGVMAFVLVFAHLLWIVEKNAKTFSQNYIPGIFESAWLVICSMSTDSFGDYVPHTWLGRIVTTGIIVGGVAIFGLLIAQVTTFLAVKKIKGEISGYRDLARRRVATVADTTSVGTLKKLGAQVIPVSHLEEAYRKLEQNEIDAVVFDAPAIAYHVKNAAPNSSRIAVVGELFEKQKYGVALQSGSALREPINQTILKLRESGYYDSLYQKWFGEDALMEI